MPTATCGLPRTVSNRLRPAAAAGVEQLRLPAQLQQAARRRRVARALRQQAAHPQVVQALRQQVVLRPRLAHLRPAVVRVAVAQLRQRAALHRRRRLRRRTLSLPQLVDAAQLRHLPHRPFPTRT